MLSFKNSYLNDFSNLSVEDVKPFKKEKPINVTPLLNEFEISHNSNDSSVNNVYFCPFDHCSNLLIFQSSEKIGKLSIFEIKFDNNEFSYEFIEDIIIGSQVNNIAWSPKTCFKDKFGTIKFAVSLFNYNEIQIITTVTQPKENDNNFSKDFDVKRCSDTQIKNFINDLAFEPISGDLIASVSDDKVCHIWDTNNGDLYSMFKLTSAGMSVKWHINEPNKLMVAEKKGIIRFYDVQTKSAVLSFSCDKSLLLSADWCKTNNFYIGCTGGTENIFWNTVQSSYPTDKIKAHIKNGEHFSFYDENVFASRGKPNSQIIVQNRRSGQVLLDREIKAGKGLSWHSKHPLLAVGAYDKVIIYHFAIVS